MHFQTQCYCTLNRLQHSANITFILTGKPKHSRDRLYCSSLEPHLNLSQACLYAHIHFLSLPAGRVYKQPHPSSDKQILVSNTILHLKKSGLLPEKADSKTRASNRQDEPRVNKEVLKKTPQAPIEGTPSGQKWNSLRSEMIVLDYNPKYKINFHESIVI